MADCETGADANCGIAVEPGEDDLDPPVARPTLRGRVGVDGMLLRVAGQRHARGAGVPAPHDPADHLAQRVQDDRPAVVDVRAEELEHLGLGRPVAHAHGVETRVTERKRQVALRRDPPVLPAAEPVARTRHHEREAPVVGGTAPAQPEEDGKREGKFVSPVVARIARSAHSPSAS